MTTAFADGLGRLGWDASRFRNLSASFSRSEERIAAARAGLDSSAADQPGIDVVAFGSLARREMTNESDLDWLVVVYEFDDQPGASKRALARADGLRTILAQDGQEVRKPGSTSLFGQMISAVDLVEVIGLQSDTNHSHTRRTLLLEESVSLHDPALHEKLLRAILTRYVEAKSLTNSRLPRFLLNDLARYWRTLTIDYQAKVGDTAPYSLRYFKLIISRKFTYISSILPLFVEQLRFEESGGDEMVDLVGLLVDSYTAPPVLRFIDAAEYLIKRDASLEVPLRQILATVDSFNANLGDGDWRTQIEEESAMENARERPAISSARALGRGLQDAIDNVFFKQPLVDLTHRYLVF